MHTHTHNSVHAHVLILVVQSSIAGPSAVALGLVRKPANGMDSRLPPADYYRFLLWIDQNLTSNQSAPMAPLNIT